jgi:hypothetical protein
MKLINMVRKDNPALSTVEAWETVNRMNAFPARFGCCIHQMPEGMSAVVKGICVRCGGSVNE